MDRLAGYRQIIHQVLAEYARYKPANGQIDTELVVDAAGNLYYVNDNSNTGIITKLGRARMHRAPSPRSARV